MGTSHKALAVVMLLAFMSVASFAQGPLQKKVFYSINVPYQVRMGNYMLPAGDYILYQIHQNNPRLFALYQGTMRREPIAMLHTVRIDYNGTDYPEETKLLIRMDESGRASRPVLRGWTIPGTDGWEIISVVPKKSSMLVRVD